LLRVHRRSLVLASLALVLFVAMALDTTYVTPGSGGAAGEVAAFSAAAYAKKTFPSLTKRIAAKAVDVTKFAPAFDANPAATGKKLGQDLGAGSFAFCIKASGTVTSADANFAVVKVPGLPAKDIVRIPLGIAVNGSPVRDCTGTIQYGDFTDQTEYQNVSDELKLIMQKQVIAPAKLASSKGRKVEVVGGFATGGPPNAFLIQPVSIKVAR
jgi:predicted lipoprotein